MTVMMRTCGHWPMCECENEDGCAVGAPMKKLAKPIIGGINKNKNADLYLAIIAAAFGFICIVTAIYLSAN